MRVAIIGTGWIAESHIQSYLKQPDVEIVAGCDLIPGKAEAFFKKFGVEGVKTNYASHKEMIDDNANLKLDAVSVCTYNRQHAAPTIYALEHGINVMLEKPMCVTIEEAAEIVKAEKKSGKVLSIGFQPRLDNNMQMIGKIVRSGALGEIYYIQTGGGRRRGIPTPFGTSFIEDKTAQTTSVQTRTIQTTYTQVTPNTQSSSALTTSHRHTFVSNPVSTVLRTVSFSTSVSLGL